ncbi:hypothetical protein ACFC5X_02945 [Streptomyces sp. NPDC055952]|uniref:hypothetical protein n=1 Tax=Streptomyces sp. NPDC055952 TaxID=3345663 RepID=UPI0035E14902
MAGALGRIRPAPPGDTDLTGWPYRARRADLEALFVERALPTALTPCPSTIDPAVAAQWLKWRGAGPEGLCFKRLDEPYRSVRSWRKYKIRVTTEAIVGAVTGSLATPRTVLLGRYDHAGRLQYIGRSTTLSPAASRALAEQLTPPPAASAHPWDGWTFNTERGTPRAVEVHVVRPNDVMEVAVDVDRDAAGRWRRPDRVHRIRTTSTRHPGACLRE